MHLIDLTKTEKWQFKDCEAMKYLLQWVWLFFSFKGNVEGYNHKLFQKYEVVNKRTLGKKRIWENKYLRMTKLRMSEEINMFLFLWMQRN